MVKISKFGNVKEKLEISGKNWKLFGKNWRFRNEFGMKNDNWKYFGHLEIIWKIGINCKLGKMFGNFGKNLKFEKFVDLEKKIRKLGE